MEEKNNLKICKMTDENLMRIMEACIRTGVPILLEEVGEVLDPSMQAILHKHIFMVVRNKSAFCILKFVKF
jgi:dynein heavy chain